MSESTSSHVFQKCWLPLTSELKMNCKHQHLRKKLIFASQTPEEWGIANRNLAIQLQAVSQICIPTSHNFISIIFSVASLTFFTSPHVCTAYSTTLLPQARSALSCPHTPLHQCTHWNCSSAAVKRHRNNFFSSAVFSGVQPQAVKKPVLISPRLVISKVS